MIYNLILRSVVGSSKPTGTNDSIIYNVDWSFLPDDKIFKVSWTFNSRQGTFSANSQALVYVSGLTAKAYEVNSASTSYKPSNCIGTIFPQMISAQADSFLYATTSDNPTFSIMRKPADTVVKVDMFNFDGTPFTAAAGAVPDYTLILSFEEEN